MCFHERSMIFNKVLVRLGRSACPEYSIHRRALGQQYRTRVDLKVLISIQKRVRRPSIRLHPR